MTISKTNHVMSKKKKEKENENDNKYKVKGKKLPVGHLTSCFTL